jgi:hypothetical protein
MLKAALIVGGLTALAPLTAQAQSWQYRCPAPGTVVERSDGSRVAYRGTDPTDPLVCLTTTGQRLVFGNWNAGSPIYRSGKAGLARLMNAAATGQTGGQVQVDYFTPGRDHNSVHVLETWRIGGIGPVTTTAGTFDTIRLERNFAIIGSTYTYDQHVWIDRATGAPVKAVVTHLNMVMAPDLVTWEAAAVQAPSVQSSR